MIAMHRVIPRVENLAFQPQKLLLCLLGALGYLVTLPISVTAAAVPLTSQLPVLMGGPEASVDERIEPSSLQPQEQQAIEAFLRKALKSTRSFTDPQDQLYSLIHIAATYQALGDREIALTLLETSVPLAQTDAYGYVEIAKVYIDIDQPQMALPLLENALYHGVTSDSDDNYYLLSNIAAAAGRLADRQQASSLILSILKAVPDLSGQQLRLVGDVVAAVGDWPGDPEGDAATAAVLFLASQMVERLIAGQTQETFWLSSTALVVQQQLATTTGSFTDIALAAPVLEKLTAVMDALAEPGDRAQGLAALAAAYTQLDQSQVGVDLLDTAVTIAMDSSQVSSQVQALTTIAATANKLGHQQLAVDVLTLVMNTIELHIESGQTDSYERALEVAIDVAAQLNDPQQAVASLENAISLTDKITWPYTKAQILQSMVGSIEQWEHRQYTLRLIAVILESARSFAPESSYSLGQTITQGMVPPDKFYDGPPLSTPQPEYGVVAVVSDVIALGAQLENSQEGQAVLEQALQTLVDTEADGVNGLSNIAQAAVQLNNPNHTAAILERVLVAVESAEPAVQASTYIAVADTYGELGNSGRSQYLLMLAMASTEQITDPWQRYIQLTNLPVRAIALNDREVAEQLLKRVVGQIEMIEDEEHRASLLGYLSSALDSWPHSRPILDRAYPLLDGLSETSNKVKGLVAIATAYAQLTSAQPDLESQALGLLDQAIVLLPELKTNADYVWPRRLRDIFIVYRHLGAYDQGHALLEQLALEQGKITNQSSREDAINVLGLQAAIAEGAMILNASQHLKTALDSIHGIATLWSRVWTRDLMGQMPEGALRDYGNTPEEQLENLFQEYKGLTLTVTPNLILETSVLLETEGNFRDPVLSDIIDNALLATLASAQSVADPGERIVPLRLVTMVALHLGKAERVSDALALAMATVHDTGGYSIELLLDGLQEPIDHRTKMLNHADLKTTVEIMTATISKMETVPDYNQSVGLVQMLLHLQEAIEPGNGSSRR